MLHVAVFFDEFTGIAALIALIALIVVDSANFQLYIAGLMGVYGKGDGLVTGGMRAVMSIGFAFF